MMKTTMARLGAMVAVGTLLGACEPHMTVIASHVTRVGPDTEVDTVWIMRGRNMLRCAGGAQGAACVAVQDQTKN